MDLNHHTGGTVDGWDSVLQSIETILATRLNSRVFRREFGSDAPLLVDAPMNDANIVRLYVAVAEAIDIWEPRFDLTGVHLSAGADGAMVLSLEGEYLPRAHMGDVSTAQTDTKAVRIQADRADIWRLAA